LDAKQAGRMVKIENPLLRSGIALAGAGPGNKRADGGVLQKYPVRQISADFEMNRCQALRQAALKQLKIVRKRYGNANPFFWGAFVFMGEP